MKKRFEVLDVFRGLFALFVALYHFKVTGGHLVSTLLVRHGSYFVDFFFVLSGFIIYHTYSRMEAGQQQKRFLLNRIARLYPLHILMLFLFLAFETAKFFLYQYGLFKNPAFEKNNAFSFASSLLMLQTFNLSPLSWNYPSWSISAEFVTYLIFCVLIVKLKSYGQLSRIMQLAALSLASLLAMVLLKGTGDIEITFNYGMFRCFYGFFMGCIVYELYTNSQRFLGRRRLLSVCEFSTLAGCMVAICYLPQSMTFFLTLLFAVTVYIFAFEGGVLSNLLNTRHLRQIGALSYSVYMVHALIALVFEIVVVNILKLKGIWISDAVTGLYLISIVITAHFSYHYVELPLGKKVKGWLLLSPLA